jgi:DNA-binding transcriptional MerR regulator
MKINEVAKITGLTKKAIYYYEQEGLLSPKKDVENGYRVFYEDDLTRLLQVSVLRRLDIPLSRIKQVAENPNDLHAILMDQLETTGNQIESLLKNQEIIRDLITKVDPHDPASMIDGFRNLNEQLFVSGSINPGFMQNELETVFPGMLGKILFIHYGQFLDEGLNNNEKITAWKEIVTKLDSLEEIAYSEQLKEAIDDLYGNIKGQDMDDLRESMKNFVDCVISGKVDLNERNVLQTAKLLEESGRKNDFLVLNKFMGQYKDFFEDLDKSMMILSIKFRDYKRCMNSLKEKAGELKPLLFTAET